MMDQPQPKPTPMSVFYSYAHEDEALRNELEKHLGLLRRQGIITSWYDRKIVAGTNWEQTLDRYLNEASIILLLVSADFLASDYCYGIEMQRAMQRHQAKEARVIPIILRPVNWKTAQFATLQALPTGGKPVTKWSSLDDAFSDVAEGITKIIDELRVLDEAHSYKADERYQMALEAYDQAISLNPNIATAYKGRGDVLFQLHRYEEALKAYDEALRLNPSDSHLHEGKGRILEQLGHDEEKHMKQAVHSHAHMKPLPIQIEKMTLLRTISAGPLVASTMSADGKSLVIVSPQMGDPHAHEVTLWDVKSGEVVKTLGKFDGSGLSRLCLSSDGKTLLSCSFRSEGAGGWGLSAVQAWNVETGKRTQTFFPRHRLPHTDQNNQYYSYEDDVVDLSEKTVVARRTGSRGEYLSTKWIEVVAMNLHTGKVTSLWETDYFQNQEDQNQNDIAALAISSDGKKVVVGSCVAKTYTSDAILSLWEGSTLLHLMRDLPFLITAITISPNSQLFATGYANGVIKLWNLSTAQLLYPLAGHESSIRALYFNSDGSQIGSVGQDGAIKIWKIDELQ